MTASNHTNWLACGLNDLSHVYSVKMWGPRQTLQSIIFPWGPDLPKNLRTFFMRTDWVGEKKVMWGKHVWGVSSVNKDTPHVRTILWLVSSVNSLILLRKCLLNASKMSTFYWPINKTSVSLHSIANLLGTVLIESNVFKWGAYGLITMSITMSKHLFSLHGLILNALIIYC